MLSKLNSLGSNQADRRIAYSGFQPPRYTLLDLISRDATSSVGVKLNPASRSRIGTISGYVGHTIDLGPGSGYAPDLTITSTGTVVGSGAGGSGPGIDVIYANAVVTNAGLIEGAAGSDGILFAAKGDLVNSGKITGGYSTQLQEAIGVSLQDGGHITNTGQISGGNGYKGTGGITGGGAGVVLEDNGVLVNAGYIFGGESYRFEDPGAGVYASSSTIINTGVISSGAGYALGISLRNSTLTTSGKIYGRTHSVSLYGGNSVLTIDPSAVFFGSIYGYQNDNKVVLSAGGTGTLSVDVDNISTFVENAGAIWTLTGNDDVGQSSLAIGGTLTVGGTLNVSGVMLLDGHAALATAGAGSIVLTGTEALYGGSISVDSGGTVSVSGTLADEGGSTISVQSDAVLSFDGDLLIGLSTEPTDAVVSGSGSLVSSGFVDFIDDLGAVGLAIEHAMTWLNTGAIDDSQLVILDASAGDTVMLINSGTFNLDAPNAALTGGNANGTNLVENSGTIIAETGVNGFSTIGINVVNTGNLGVDSGTCFLDGVVSGGGELFATNGATLAFVSGTLSGISSGTLTSGTLSAMYGGIIQLSNNSGISVDGSDIVLDGPGSSIESLDTANDTERQLGATLQSIAEGGRLSFENGGDFNAGANAGTFTDAGLLTLASANFCATTLNVMNTGTLSGAGTFSADVDSDGLLMATTGTLILADSVINSGTLAIAANATTVFDSIVDNKGIIAATGGVGVFGGLVTNTKAIDGTGGMLTFATLDNAGVIHEKGGRLDITTSLANSGTITSSAGTMVLAGSTTNSGTISTARGVVMFEGSVTNTGKLIADGGTLSLKAATLTNLTGSTLAAGTLRADENSVLQLPNNTSIIVDSGNLTLDGIGSLIESLNTEENKEIALGSTLDSITSSGTFSLVDGRNFTAQANHGTFGNSGLFILEDVTFGANVLANSSGATLEGNSTVNAALLNSGLVEALKGSLIFTGNVTNNGTINTGTTSVTLNGPIGTGSLEIGTGGTLSLLDGAASGQMVDFLAGTGLADITNASAFFGTLCGFGHADQIDLLGVAQTSFSYADGVLTIMNFNTVVASLHFDGDYNVGDFSVTPDPHGGSLIKFKG